MAIQYPTFRGDPTNTYDTSTGDIAGNVSAGMKLAMMPKQMKQQQQMRQQQMQQKQQASAMQQSLGQAKMQQMGAQTGLTQAKTQQMQDPKYQAVQQAMQQAKINQLISQSGLSEAKTQQMQNPQAQSMDFSKGVSGDPMNMLRGHQMIAQGQQSGNQQMIDNGQSILDQVSLQNQYRQATAQRQQSLAGTAQKRASTSQAKGEQEINDINNMRYPGTNIPIESEEKQQQLLNRAGLSQTKAISDSTTRQRNLFATTMDQTIDSIDSDIIGKYSGPGGKAKLTSDHLSSLLGNTPDDYMKYQKNSSNIKAAKEQVSKFFSTPATEGAQKELLSLLDTASASTAPDVAKEKFDEFRRTLKKELATYREALQDTGAFTGKPSPQSGAQSNISNNDPLGIL